MKLISYGSVVLASERIAQNVLVRGLPGEDRSPIWLDAAGNEPTLAGIRRGGRALTARFHVDPALEVNADSREAILLDLIGGIYDQGEEPVELVCQIRTDTNADGIGDTNVTISADAILGPWTWEPSDLKAISVTFYLTSPWWEGDLATSGPTSISTSGNDIVLTNDGLTTTYPIIRLGWSVLRGTGGVSSTCGWRFKKTITVTNSSTDNWLDELIAIDLGDTAALVSGSRAQSDGDDLRVHWRGAELPRELLGWNLTQTFCVIALTLPAGESATLEVVYGNSAATTPKKLTNYQGVYGLDEYAAVNLDSDSGTATGGATGNLQDTGKSWTTDRWLGGFILLLSGTGSATHACRRISSNTATQINVERNFTSAPAAGTTYLLWMGGWMFMGGAPSSATSSSITDSSAAYNTNELVGGTVRIISGTGASATEYAIASNTATVINISSTFSVTPDTSSRYRIRRHGYWTWRTQQQTIYGSNSFGGWRASQRNRKPGRVWFRQDGVAYAWDRILYLANQDDYNQTRYYWDSANSRTYPILNAKRRLGSDRRLEDKGQSDGVAFYSAMGVSGHKFDYTIQNQNGVGQFAVLSRESGGEQWSEEHTYSGTHASLTDRSAVYVDMSSAPPKEIAHVVLPADGIAMAPTGKKTDQINVLWNDVLQVWLDQTYVTIGTLSAEVNAYDLQVKLQIGTRHRIQVGGPGHWWHPESSDILVVDCSTGEIYTFGGLIDDPITSWTYVPWAAVVEEVGETIEGAAEWLPSDAWFPLPVGSTSVDVAETAMGTVDLYILWLERYIA